MSKVVFVGNVPYNMGEEQLIDVFKSVGQVVGFRLVFDRDTGKPRGYGFCEFADHATAASAVRNLNAVDVGGRPLRIDLADSDPFLEGKTTVRGELVDSGETRAQWRERQGGVGVGGGVGGGLGGKDAWLKRLPGGVPVPVGATALDVISQTLATMPPADLIEVLAQMKAFVITHPDDARALLVAHPQIAYALFQALLLNKIVDPAILERMLSATTASVPGQAPARPPQPPPHVPTPPFHAPPPAAAVPPPFFQPPPQTAYQPSQAAYQPPQPQPQPQAPPFQAPQYGGYGAPPPAAPTPARIENLNIDPAQRAMLMQVLSLTPDQIARLQPHERETILNLRSQLGGA